MVSVQGGVPHLTRRHDPEQAVTFDRVRPRALAGAARLKSQSSIGRGFGSGCKPSWSSGRSFPKASLKTTGACSSMAHNCAHGSRISPTRLSRADVGKIFVGIETAAESFKSADLARVDRAMRDVRDRCR